MKPENSDKIGLNIRGTSRNTLNDRVFFKVLETGVIRYKLYHLPPPYIP